MDEHVDVNSYVMSGNQFKFNDKSILSKTKITKYAQQTKIMKYQS